MNRLLEDFIRVLRSAGIRISTPEYIDMLDAMDIINYSDREMMKGALSVVLAKSLSEKEIFSKCFDRFFSLENFSNIKLSLSEKACIDENITSPLTGMLFSGDSYSLTAAMMEAGKASGIGSIKYLTQRNIYAMRILNNMGIDGLDHDIKIFEQSIGSNHNALKLKEAREYLVESVRKFVQRQFDLYAKPGQESQREEYLKNLKLSMMEKRDFDRMDTIIRKIVKRLNDVHSRRKKISRRGQLDLKKTLRKNIVYGGVPFNTTWKKKKIDRPDVVAICDVSRSVWSVVRFFLLFLYRLNDILVRRRTFIFCTNIIEVSKILEQYPVDEAVAKMQRGSGLGIIMGLTDYGSAFREFEKNWLDAITGKTTIIILGDARNNYGNPETGILKNIQRKCKRLIWLNPNVPYLWGSGDSEMKRYLPFCNLARECNTINHLEKLIDSIL